MNNLWNYKTYKQNRSDFLKTSYDSKNNISLSNSKYDNVVDMDSAKDWYANNVDSNFSKYYLSVDALSIINNQVVFVEFKDCDVRKERKNILQKVHDSISLHCSVTRESVFDVRNCYDFILVYREKKNYSKAFGVKQLTIDIPQDEHPMRRFQKWFSYKAGNWEMILFGFHELQGKLFRGVHTYSESQFAKFLVANGITV